MASGLRINFATKKREVEHVFWILSHAYHFIGDWVWLLLVLLLIFMLIVIIQTLRSGKTGFGKIVFTYRQIMFWIFMCLYLLFILVILYFLAFLLMMKLYMARG